MSIGNYQTAYFDESRVDGSARFPIVAGFWAGIEIWDFVDRDIRKELARKPKNLKAKKYLQGNPALFSKIFAKYELQPIYSSVELAVFKSIQDTEENKRAFPLMKSTYTACCYMCCEILDKQARSIALRNPMKVIFDAGTPHQTQLVRGYEKYYRSKEKTYLEPSPGFDTEEHTTPLLAAHLYAWLVSKEINECPKLAEDEVNRSLYEIHKANAPRKTVVTEESIRRIMGR